MQGVLFKFINRCREFLIFKLFYWTIRVGLGMTFLISGIRKLPGVKFTQIPMVDSEGVENLVGLYFYAMHETGFYWNFIGYVQIMLGIFVFFNRFVILVFVLMMPITINICLISFALNMRGTPIITTCMVLGNVFLLLWHYEAYLPLLKSAKNTSLR